MCTDSQTRTLALALAYLPFWSGGVATGDLDGERAAELDGNPSLVTWLKMIEMSSFSSSLGDLGENKLFCIAMLTFHISF